MQVKAIKHFISPRYGEMKGGQIKDIPDGDARKMIGHGMVEEYETKVIRDQPRTPNVPSDAGEESESSSSPAGRRSRKKTARRSRASESSSSTEPSD